MTSTESKEPKGSEGSSTDLCGCGATRAQHVNAEGACYGEGCDCDRFQLPLEQMHKWKRCTHCSHREHSARCMEASVPGTRSWTGRCGCLELTSAREIEDKCKGAGGCPEHPTERQKGEREPLLEICACMHPRQKHRNLGEDTVVCEGGGLPCSCDGFEDDAPPLTPEEEEEAGTKFCPCGNYVAPHPFPGCEPPPPQPQRRPPHAYAYSVQGHLYEVALPGDATVVAQDGALIITHSLGPVAGIVQVRPLEGEQN